MAYATSNKYKQFIYDEDSKQSIEIIINGNIVDSSYIRSFKLTDEIFEEEIFSLGSAITSKVILELNNEVFNDITSNFDAMTFVFKLETDSGIEVVPMGRYIIKEKDESSSYFTKFTLYDYMDKFDVVFDASEIVPCTRYELLQAICEYCGVELENKSILNGDVEVGVYDNTITAKTYLSLISERAGGFAKINRNNKLVIKTLSDVDTVELPDYKVGDYTTNELKTVTRIVYENATQKFESGTEDGVTIYLSQDSPFSCSQQEVDNILQKLKGLQYQTLDVRVWGDPSIDTGDIITFDNIKSFAQKDWSFGNGFYGSYKTILNDSKSTLNVSKLSGNTKRKRLESKMNEVEGTIYLLSEEVDESSKKVSQFQIDLEGITSSVSKTEELVTELEKSIQEFSVDLDIYNLIIPCNETNNPLEDKEYTINHYSYFLGTQVKVLPTTTDNIEGLKITLTDESINILAEASTTIPNINNELSLSFSYTDENDEIHYISKKLQITLSQKGADGQDGETGPQGPKGEDGTSSFFHVRYSANSTGNPMTEVPTSDTEYLGVSSTTSPTPPTNYSAYKWSKIKGENGTNGTPGKAGEDGQTSYLHIKYSEDGQTFTPADEDLGYEEGEKPSAWYGQYVDFNEEDSTNFEDYNWYKFTENIDGTLSDLQKQIDSNSNEMVGLENNLKSTNEKFNDYAREDSVVERIKNVDQKITENSLKISAVDEILENGVTKVKTETGYTFDKDGLKIQKTGSEMSSLLDNDGLVVKRDNTEVLTVRSSGVETENLKVRTYLFVGNNIRIEDYDGGTGFFYVGGGN